MLGIFTLEEVFKGKKTYLGHILIFGCFVYFNVPKEKRTSLEHAAEKVILVGYNKTSKSYFFYITALRKTIVRRDVTF